VVRILLRGGLGGPPYRMKNLLLFLSLSVVALARAAGPAEVTISGQKLIDLGFENLSSFPYNIVDGGTGATKEQIQAASKVDQIPAAVHAFDGKKVVLTGYMLPLQMENGLAKKFVLMKDTNTCCFGGTPKMNDYVVCQMSSNGVESIQDIPVQLTGTLHVQEKREDGYVVSLFTMDGEKFLGPRK
jgi:hypothetical protein